MKQSITIEQKIALILRFGTLSSNHKTATYYFTPNKEALDSFGYPKEEQEEYAPYWGDSLAEVVDMAFDSLISTYLKKGEDF
jgi:hypothetical protein